MTPLTFTVPYPPSTNVYWRHVGSRVLLSREARTYKARVGLQLKSAKLKPMTGAVGLMLEVFRPRKIGDLSNRIKVLEDALQGFAFTDDSQVEQILAFRRDDKENPRVRVTVWRLVESIGAPGCLPPNNFEPGSFTPFDADDFNGRPAK